MKVKALECIGKKQIIMSEFEKPKVEYGCMLLKILSCGICGTDLHGIEGKRDVAYPFIPGHEIVAVVEEIGKNAEKTIKVFGADKLKTGMKVTINPRIVCNHCFFCKEMPQDPQKCLNALTATSIGSDKPPHIFGGFAEYLYVLPGSEIIAIDQKTDILIGALIEPFSCGIGLVDRHKRFYNAISGNGFQIVEPVVVYGTGAIGMLMIAAFKTAGAENIIAVDTSEERLQLSREFGANHTINVSETDSAYRTKQIRKITEIGAGIAVESCGVPSVITEAVYSLRRGGKLYEVGHLLNAGMAQIDPFYICRNEIEILGNYAYPSSNTMKFAAEILSKREFPYEKLVKEVKFMDGIRAISENDFAHAIKPVLIME